MKTFLNVRTSVPAIALIIAMTFFLTTIHHAGAAEPKNYARQGNEVRIDNFTFQAPILTVPVGTEVTWVNRDDIPHTVVSTDNVFKSKALDTDEKFSFKFTQPGTYKYFCSIHPKMTAEVVVK